MAHPGGGKYNIIGVTERLIKFYHRIVGCSNLEINLWTPFGPDASFNFLHYAATISLPPMGRIDCQVINPTAVPFIPSHDRGDDLSIYNSNQKKVSVYFYQFGEHTIWGLSARVLVDLVGRISG